MTYTVRKVNKYGAIKTEYNGSKYDSKFEASVARDLDIRLKAGEIKDWERQFKVEMWAYNCHGERAMKVSHKVDFRVHELDGSYTLLEAKGIETADYKMRRNWLEAFWLPEHLDHVYEVVKERSGYVNSMRKGRKK
jgi:hypothetical protein